MPILERAYGRMIAELTEGLNEDDDPLDTDFALQEFLDRYGMRLTQLGTILDPHEVPNNPPGHVELVRQPFEGLYEACPRWLGLGLKLLQCSFERC